MKPEISSSSPDTTDAAVSTHQQKLNKCLVEAVCSGDEFEVQRLLTTGADLHIRSGEARKTALEWAVDSYASSAPEIVSILMTHGSDPNAPCPTNELGRSPFMSACVAGRGKLIIAMLDANGPVKIDLTLMDRHQRLPSVFIANLSSEPCKPPFALMNKVQAYFEKHTLPKNAEDETDQTVQRGHLWLSTDKNGQNSFMHNSTIENKQWMLDQKFVDSEKMIEARDNEGRTALWLAVNYGRKDHVEFFLSHGAKINTANALSKPLLDMAKERVFGAYADSAIERKEILSHLQAINSLRRAKKAVDGVTKSQGNCGQAEP